MLVRLPLVVAGWISILFLLIALISAPTVIGRLSGTACNGCLLLTAVNPSGGDCDVSMLLTGLPAAPTSSMGDLGDSFDWSMPFDGSVSASRLDMIADLRPLSL